MLCFVCYSGSGYNSPVPLFRSGRYGVFNKSKHIRQLVLGITFNLFPTDVLARYTTSKIKAHIIVYEGGWYNAIGI